MSLLAAFADTCPEGGDHEFVYRHAKQAYHLAVVNFYFPAYPWHEFPRGHPWRDGMYCTRCGKRRDD